MGTQRNPVLTLLLLAALAAPGAGFANESDDAAELEAIIAAIEHGWENADGTPFYTHFLGQDGARFIESGGQNEGLRDLVEHHVEPEGDVLDGLDLTFTNIEIHVEGDFAWALADVMVRATVKKDGRQIHNRGHETFLFRRTADGWKVIHTHSSTRSMR
jgi:ketosteroid isomerase-like protein